MGAATRAILTAAALFVPDADLPPSTITLENGKPLTFGPFTVTPVLVDHSAYAHRGRAAWTTPQARKLAERDPWRFHRLARRTTACQCDARE
jgi:hypothetical protein